MGWVGEAHAGGAAGGGWTRSRTTSTRWRATPPTSAASSAPPAPAGPRVRRGGGVPIRSGAVRIRSERTNSWLGLEASVALVRGALKRGSEAPRSRPGAIGALARRRRPRDIPPPPRQQQQQVLMYGPKELYPGHHQGTLVLGYPSAALTAAAAATVNNEARQVIIMFFDQVIIKFRFLHWFRDIPRPP